MSNDEKVAGPCGSPLTEGLGLPVLAYDAGNDVQIQAAKQIDGSTLWAVRRNGTVLAKDSSWEFEPMPSSRDDEFLARCRYATPREALDALNATWHGRPNA
jgi:hypothetical protein